MFSAATTAGSPPRLTPSSCLHCGLPSAAGDYCCAGCEAIAAALSGKPFTPEPLETSSHELAHYDDPVVSARFVRAVHEASVEAFFVVEGLRCGACAWLVERAIEGVPGVTAAEANYSTARVRVAWNPLIARPSAILGAARGADLRGRVA